MWQTVTMAPSINVSLIDNHRIGFNFSAWIGGYRTQDDNAAASLTFLDQGSQKVGNTVTLGPVMAMDRQNITSLIFQQTNGLVPAGARSFLAIITMTCLQPIDNDGCIDNIAVLLYQ